MAQVVNNKATKYCLYARKSTEEDERQALSIDSQIKEMTQLAEKDGLNIVEIRRESHSAKESGKREVFNSLIRDINSGIFDGIITWNTDRISRNASDLGLVVDLIDKHLLKEIKTYNQAFTNTPNDKFMLMILGGQAKLENDNKSINVKRGLKAKVGLGLWVGQTPVGYLNEKNVDKKGYVNIDPYRGPIIKEMFRKIAYDNYSGRKILDWLKSINYKSINGKMMSLGNIFRIIKNTFYYGMYEYPKNSGNWYQGKHEPLTTKKIYDLVQEKIGKDMCFSQGSSYEFAYSGLFKCGLCDSGMVGEHKRKKLKNDNILHYIYYGCSRGKDRDCKNSYIREEEITKQLVEIIDTLKVDELGINKNIEEEIERYNSFRRNVLGISKEENHNDIIDTKTYAKFILRDGTLEQKKQLTSCIKSNFKIINKKIIVRN
ncbi:recombinase family protein [Patescibacteria group bacterium]|nr:recombinase family protein [Patescibacteria group bacterium]